MVKEIIAAILSGLVLVCALPTQEESTMGKTIPAELEYLPESYQQPAGHPGTLEKLTYDTGILQL